MGMAMAGVTHCKECWKPLKDDEYYMCKNCREKENQNNKKKQNKEKKNMNKKYKGKEIFKMIAEGSIDKNTKVTVDNYDECTLGFVFEDERNLFEWLNKDFELIEDEEIDIDSIEEFEFGEIEDRTNYENRSKINKIIRALKHLNKEIQSIKEK